MSSLSRGKEVIRRSFGRIKDVIPVPDLIEVQSRSFNEFVQLDYLPSERVAVGLEKVFRDVFPIAYSDRMSLEYVSYELGNWTCTCGGLAGIVNRYTWDCLSCKKSGCSRLDAQLTCPHCAEKTASYRTCANCLTRVSLHLPLTIDECRSSGQTFSMPLKATIRLVSWDVDEQGNKLMHSIKEQEIFFADIPVMANVYEKHGRIMLGNLGTFLINGVDRVIVSQLHRSPGVVFSPSKKIKDIRGKSHYLARIIPMRGSWMDLEFDVNDFLYVRIDKKKKLLATTFLQALGIPRDEIVSLFYQADTLIAERGSLYQPLSEAAVGMRLEEGMIESSGAASLIGKKLTLPAIEQLKAAGVTRLLLRKEALLNRVVATDVVDAQTGEVLLEQGSSLTEERITRLQAYSHIQFSLIAASGYTAQPTISLTLAQDKCRSQEEALRELHTKLWPGDSSSLKEIKESLENLFYNQRFYDLTKVGRVRMNRKLGLAIDDRVTVLTREDILATMRYLVNLRERGEGELDDIDHLGNRRVRLVGELLMNQVYLGFLRIERIVRERFRVQEFHGALMPQDFLSVKPLSAVLREFFGTGQLSQFMDQTNPLSEIAHKRRLSALGPGGVLKDRATYEIRDVHTSHYGRICPIETPEGQTIGLISSLATYAIVNELGFIETGYRPVHNRMVQDEVVFLDAFQEAGKYVAQANEPNPKSNRLEHKFVFVRHDGNFMYTDVDKVDYVDLSPKQLVSVATALIPFLEHDDASRALMGANMQRQAVPLIRPEPPLIGTGMEAEIARASGSCIVARRAGVVDYVSSDKIVVRADESAFGNVEDWISQGVDVYHLRKFQRSSHFTWVHQSPAVKPGDHVAEGDMLSTAASIEQGELALGRNLLVAYMPWYGYNFEDAIVLNKRLVNDALSSVFIDEYVVEARDTKLGPEEITRDIPNVSEIALAGLDEDGIVRVGTRVKTGDILVGKVTLKGDVQYSPEEKLLRAIFGEKSREVRDTSLRVPPGLSGTVIGVKIFSRSGVRKDKRYRDLVIRETARLEADFTMQMASVEKMVHQKLVSLMEGKKPQAKTSKDVVQDGLLNVELLQKLSLKELLELRTAQAAINTKIEQLKKTLENQVRILRGLQEERLNRLKKGDPLPSGIIKMIKVYIAAKRSVQVGDKLAGRHGNKGVVSIIVPSEDMPFLDNGRAIDIVLNPIGVPSRMNIGQILEAILGSVGHEMAHRLGEQIAQESYDSLKGHLQLYYGKDLIDDYEKHHGRDEVTELARRTARYGVRFKTPVFDGGSFEEDIQPLLRSLDLPETGTYRLRDGRSGEYLDQPVTVGTTYIMKLNHMVDDKLHARSVGPYSLVTQQPLGGKAQMGGQRFGEMEFWALEAYGAAYALQEMLTYKSDDIAGRHKVYEAIVRGEDIPTPGLPESFNVLVKELQSLALRIDLLKSSKEESGE